MCLFSTSSFPNSKFKYPHHRVETKNFIPALLTKISFYYSTTTRLLYIYFALDVRSFAWKNIGAVFLYIGLFVCTNYNLLIKPPHSAHKRIFRTDTHTHMCSSIYGRVRASRNTTKTRTRTWLSTAVFTIFLTNNYTGF
jgi:hypothetical protein